MAASVTRRKVISGAGAAVAGAASLHAADAPVLGTKPTRLKVLVAGAHPDDPETGAGGLICRYTDAGHEVAVLYLTTGEAGIPGKSHDEAARIRRVEALEACRILRARPVFAGQIDGSSRVDAEAYAAIGRVVEAENADVLFTHWPIDTHPDHRHCSALVLGAWYRTGRRAALYFYEVMSGAQTQVFEPTHYVDIGSVVERKHEACFAHVSQGVREGYDKDHGRMEIFRGMEAGVAHAEALVRHPQGPDGRLP